MRNATGLRPLPDTSYTVSVRFLIMFISILQISMVAGIISFKMITNLKKKIKEDLVLYNYIKCWETAEVVESDSISPEVGTIMELMIVTTSTFSIRHLSRVTTIVDLNGFSTWKNKPLVKQTRNPLQMKECASERYST